MQPLLPLQGSEKSWRGSHRARARSRLLPRTSKKISRVSPSCSSYVRNVSSRGRRVRHGAQCIVCSANSIGNLCFRTSALSALSDYRIIYSELSVLSDGGRVFLEFFVESPNTSVKDVLFVTICILNILPQLDIADNLIKEWNVVQKQNLRSWL